MAETANGKGANGGRGNFRRARGPRALAESVGGLTKPLFQKRGLADGRIVREWPRIVGPQLAAHTLPEKIAYAPHKSAEGTLELRIDGGGLALELQHLAPILIEKVNAYFGYNAVARLHFVQGPLPVRDEVTPPPAERPLEPEEEAALAHSLEGVEDPGLRAALESLGRTVLGHRED